MCWLCLLCCCVWFWHGGVGANAFFFFVVFFVLFLVVFVLGCCGGVGICMCASVDVYIYSVVVQKRGLSGFDDKKFILDDGISTLSYGHKQLFKN